MHQAANRFKGFFYRASRSCQKQDFFINSLWRDGWVCLSKEKMNSLLLDVSLESFANGVHMDRKIKFILNLYKLICMLFYDLLSHQ